MSYRKVRLIYICFAFALNLFVGVQAVVPKKESVYQQELKALQQRPFYKTMLDRRSAGGPKNILANIENAKELNLFQRWLRYSLLARNPIAVTADSMPRLHAFVKEVCIQWDMRMPTIFVTKNKTTFFGGSTSHADSTKILMSSGAILIGQDLLREVSPKALEAAIAHQLCHVKYNHGNKEWFIKWIAPGLVGSFLPGGDEPQAEDDEPQAEDDEPQAEGDEELQVLLNDLSAQLPSRAQLRNKAICFIVVRLLLAKRFEKQADRFVYEAMNNAEGLIELCAYWQHKEQRVDTEYDDVAEYLRTSDIALIDYIFGGLGYHFYRTGHRLYKLGRWIVRNTPFWSTQSYQTRINAAQRYLNMQNQ